MIVHSIVAREAVSKCTFIVSFFLEGGEHGKADVFQGLGGGMMIRSSKITSYGSFSG